MYVFACIQAFPSRGSMRLLDKAHTEGTRAPIERWVAEDLMLDLMATFEGGRVECVRRLVGGMPTPWEHRNLLAELLFGQMMALGRPRLHPMAYSTLMVDLCKVCGAGSLDGGGHGSWSLILGHQGESSPRKPRGECWDGHTETVGPVEP